MNECFAIDEAQFNARRFLGPVQVEAPELELGSGFAPGEEEELDGLELHEFARRSDEPTPVPRDNPVPFAESRVAPNQRVWPVITQHPQRSTVSYETVDGRTMGRPSRKFLASRSGGGRLHVAIDLFANHRDEVVACEDGRIVNFYAFYSSSADEMTYALIVEHAGFVVNYGEVSESAPQEYGWQIGSHVRAGQKIARVSTTSMLHFETYVVGTEHNYRWLPGQARPRELLNPTAYLLELLSHFLLSLCRAPVY